MERAESLDNRQSLLGKLQAHGGETIVQGSARGISECEYGLPVDS